MILKILLTIIILLKINLSLLYETNVHNLTSKKFYEILTTKENNTKTKLNQSINVVYITPWNKKGEDMILNYASKIDILVPTWFEFKSEFLNNEYNTMIDGSNYIDKDLIKNLKSLNPSLLIIPRFTCSNLNSDYLDKVMSKKNSEKLIKSIIKRIKFSKFDGITLECLQYLIRDDLYASYSMFQMSLYEELKKLDVNKKLLITFLPYSENIFLSVNKNRYEYLNKYLDYSLIMTYDYMRYTSGNNKTYKTINNSPITWLSKSIENYISSGINNEKNNNLLKKVIIGIPFHGISLDITNYEELKGNIVDSFKLNSLLEHSQDFDIIWDDVEKEHMFDVSIENSVYRTIVPSDLFIKERIKYASDNNLAGIFVWDIGQGFDSWMDCL